MSLMKIRQATINDYDQIMTILKDGANQLAERGVDQWKGFAYLAVSADGETVGAISIVEAPDHSYDNLKGKWLRNTDKYVVIHRVAIHSKHAGNGYATKLLTEVIDYIRDNRKDIDSIRIDTHENNTAMQHLIDKMNFTKVGELHGVYRPDEISYVYENVRE